MLKNWDIKDRTYVLKGKKKPLTHKIKTRGMLWFDDTKGVNREIRYATNQNTLFVDEQDDHVRLGHVVFTDGMLFVPRTQPMLQQLLSFYYPENQRKWKEIDKKKIATDDVETFENKLDALNLARELEVDQLEAIMRAEYGSKINNLSSKELKRDAYQFANTNPRLFTELANDSEVELRNIANKAVESGIVKLTDNNTKFKWAVNGREIMTVPFDAHPYTAFAQFFKTDEGAAVLKSIEKKLE